MFRMDKPNKEIIIKVGRKEQAGKDIYLYNDGSVKCGEFTMKGNQSREFQGLYNFVIQEIYVKTTTEHIDVSTFVEWDAVKICDDMIERFVKSISYKRIDRLAKETIISKGVVSILESFEKELHRKWLRIFRKWEDREDPLMPKEPWQIL